MQEESCQKHDIINSDLQELIILIIQESNITALNALIQKISDHLNYPSNAFTDLEMLSLYYLYYVWMDEETRNNFPVLFLLLNKDLSEIWNQLLENKDYLSSEISTSSDIFKDTLRSIANDIAYKYFNGAIGVDRHNQSIYTLLYKLNESNYSTISDNLLKLLFFGYCQYGKELFGTQAEWDVFKAFILSKSYIIFINPEIACINNEEQKIESQVTKLTLF